MGVKISLKQMEKRLDVLKNERIRGGISSIVFQVGLRGKLLILQNWLRGRGADDKSFPKLSSAYLKKKTSQGKGSRRNLLMSGDLQRGLEVRKLGQNRAKLRFSVDQVPKARGNVSIASAMLKPVSSRIEKKLKKLAFKLFQGLVR